MTRDNGYRCGVDVSVWYVCLGFKYPIKRRYSWIDVLVHEWV